MAKEKQEQEWWPGHVEPIELKSPWAVAWEWLLQPSGQTLLKTGGRLQLEEQFSRVQLSLAMEEGQKGDSRVSGANVGEQHS